MLSIIVQFLRNPAFLLLFIEKPFKATSSIAAFGNSLQIWGSGGRTSNHKKNTVKT